MTGDPVAWIMIAKGWGVYTSDGEHVGRIEEIAGDENADIFDGLAIATSALGKPRYVPAEEIERIEQGVVRLRLSRDQADRLGEYLEPATSAVIEPDSKGGIGETLASDARRLEGKAFAPTQGHEHSMNFWRRLAFFFRRRGR